MTLLDKIETPEGSVIVITKTRYLWIVPLPRTSVMPWRATQLVDRGIQFHWNSSKHDTLQFLHNSLLQTLREGLGLSDLRRIADLGRQLMSIGPGVPFIPPDAPLPDSLKQVSPYVKGVI
jgi:hypothetical protein